MRTATAALAGLVTVGAAVQAFLAMATMKGAGSQALDVHRWLGSALLVVGVLAAVTAMRAFPGNQGMRGHAWAAPLLMLLQMPLARADGWLGGVHGFLAVLVAVAAVTLATSAARRPA